ncbi:MULTISPECIES: nitroreductase family protein [Bradyrhizobium]|uniref:nitroreductase family protein n=1 Tax=Bradyrhizobium TaxID=374 RepID=UPI0003F78183|nr:MULTISPECIES: nitroreductase family protein [Bradyrhizobium]WLB86827.1 nitroreductase family protein [Bradyrhizobium japonicum USDA 135]GLR97847.1 nitroreductase [Bradyrhizobium liaoningense]
MTTKVNARTADHAIESIFLERWSPRAFTPEIISEGDLLKLVEAARWAPSSYNSQPWRFIYARRGTTHWEKLLGLLNEFNRTWAKNAAALLIVVSKQTMVVPGQDQEMPSHTHSFDTGAAWAMLALQAAMLGWQAHGMVGFDIPRAATELGVPTGYRVEAAIAIGKAGDKSLLPPALQMREMPSSRNPIAAIAFEGAMAESG